MEISEKSFRFLFGIDTLYEYILISECGFFSRNILFSTVHYPCEKRICFGYRHRLALIQQNIESFYIVCNHASGNRLFFKSHILCSGTHGQSDGQPIYRCPMVGFHGRNDGRLQHLRRYRHREDTLGCSGSAGHDDVSDFHGLCYPSGTANKPTQTAIKTDPTFLCQKRRIRN